VPGKPCGGADGRLFESTPQPLSENRVANNKKTIDFPLATILIEKVLVVFELNIPRRGIE
jgi:hypothetical protein